MNKRIPVVEDQGNGEEALAAVAKERPHWASSHTLLRMKPPPVDRSC
jgi:hypothetical protein